MVCRRRKKQLSVRHSVRKHPIDSDFKADRCLPRNRDLHFHLLLANTEESRLMHVHSAYNVPQDIPGAGISKSLVRSQEFGATIIAPAVWVACKNLDDLKGRLRERQEPAIP